jgi:hypothetical protein
LIIIASADGLVIIVIYFSTVLSFISHPTIPTFVCLVYMLSAADFGGCHHGRCVVGGGGGAGIFFCPSLPNLLSRVHWLTVCRKLT